MEYFFTNKTWLLIKLVLFYFYYYFFKFYTSNHASLQPSIIDGAKWRLKIISIHTKNLNRIKVIKEETVRKLKISSTNNHVWWFVNGS